MVNTTRINVLRSHCGSHSFQKFICEKSEALSAAAQVFVFLA